MDDGIVRVVIDNGSSMTKAGFGGDDAPKVYFPTAVLKESSNNSINNPSGYINDRAQNENRNNRLYFNYPIEYGYITNWDDMEKLWGQIYNDLEVKSEQMPVLFSETPLDSNLNREKLITTFFETFGVPAYYSTISQILSLYSSGRTTGIILDIGDTYTCTVPIYYSCSLKHGINKENYGGRNITKYLIKLLEERGFTFLSSAERDLVREIKEKTAFISNHNEINSIQDNEEQEYELPDENKISIGNERFKCPEALFQPHLFGFIDKKPVHEMIYDSICVKIDQDLKQDLLYNVVLAGGSTLFPTISERINKEMRALLPSKYKCSIVAPPDRKYSSWIGGSILSSLSTIQQLEVTKNEYDEIGPHIIHPKCHY